MHPYIFDIILIIIALAILFHLVYNNWVAPPQSNNCGYQLQKEQMNNVSINNEGETDISITNKEKKAIDAITTIINNNQSGSELAKESKKTANELLLDVDSIEKETKYNYIGPEYKDIYMDVFGNDTTQQTNDLEIKRYLNDYVLDGKMQCEADKSQSVFNRTEIDNYREQSFDFQNKINGSSAPAIDPVDRVNQNRLSGGIKATGQTISNYYDNLIDPNNNPTLQIRKPLNYNQTQGRCIKPPIIDSKNGIPQSFYKGNKNILIDNWVYPNEKPNNGGILYDGITGDDPFNDTLRAHDL